MSENHIDSEATSKRLVVSYHLSMFQKDGKVTLPVIREVQNENCLFCHYGSDWKKRGSSYNYRTDVHIRARLRCIDCHLTGRHAKDPRIYGKEEHQIGKGDDPGDFVRDDLDNTMRQCEDCHIKGILNAPIPHHPVMQRPFDEGGKPAYEPQYKIMGFDGRPRSYSGIAGMTASFFRWLTIIVLTGLFIHMTLDFFARRREIQKAKNEGASLKTARQSENEYQRFNPNFLAQHLLLAASIILLSLSGIFLWGLRYPGVHWAAALTSVCGGIDFWRLIHRGGALLLVFDCVYHLVYTMVHPEGRRDFVLMLPRLKDFRDFVYNLPGLSCGSRMCLKCCCPV